MKVFTVLASSTFAALVAGDHHCVLNANKNGCVSNTHCYFSPARTFQAAVANQYNCVPAPPMHCVNGATVQDLSTQEKADLALKCTGTKGTEQECVDITRGCAAAKVRGNPQIDAKPAECLVKSCSMYTSQNNCEAADCDFEPAWTGTATTYKCQAETGNAGTSDANCKAVPAGVNPVCGTLQNGGVNCCTRIIDVEGEPSRTAWCEEKSSAAVVVTSAFAATAAALLM